MSEHRARYKNTGLNPTELRRRREEGSIQLRKQKRDDVLSNKRRLHDIDFQIHDDIELDTQLTDVELKGQIIEDFMQNHDLELILASAIRIRKCLTKEPCPPFEEAVAAGIIPRSVELLSFSSPSIQFEVAWILTNISSSISEHTRAVAESGAVPKLVQLVRSDDVKLKEQVIWALGNIIGDGSELRDLVISCGFIPPLLEVIDLNLDANFLTNLAWVVVNLCRYKDPPVHVDIIRQLIPKIKLLLKVNDLKVLLDTTWAISYIIELGPEYFELVLDPELIAIMIPILESNEPKLLTSTVRAIGCMATGSDDQTQIIINAGVLPVLNRVLHGQNPKVAKDIIWLISNVAAGTVEQVQAIIDSGFVSSIVHYLRVGDFNQQKEATWAIFNLTVTGSDEQLQRIVDSEAVPAICDLLTINDPTIQKKSLESLKNLLQKIDEVNYEIEKCGGLDKIESLQSSPIDEIYDIAFSILSTYFNQPDHET